MLHVRQAVGIDIDLEIVEIDHHIIVVGFAFLHESQAVFRIDRGGGFRQHPDAQHRGGRPLDQLIELLPGDVGDDHQFIFCIHILSLRRPRRCGGFGCFFILF